MSEGQKIYSVIILMRCTEKLFKFEYWLKPRNILTIQCYYVVTLVYLSHVTEFEVVKLCRKDIIVVKPWIFTKFYLLWNPKYNFYIRKNIRYLNFIQLSHWNDHNCDLWTKPCCPSDICWKDNIISFCNFFETRYRRGN